MSDRKEFERQLDELASQAVQAVDVSVREQVEYQIADDPLSQTRWQELLTENECLHAALNQVDVPDNLEDRILSDSLASIEQRPLVTRIPGWVWALAAMLLVAVGIAVGTGMRNSHRLQTVALLAINNHLNHLDDHSDTPELESQTALATGLSREVGFAVSFPELDERLQLSGGRKCKLGTHTVAFSLWKQLDKNYSLFQFRKSDFGISGDMHPRLVNATEPAGGQHPCGAWIWTDQSSGFVLVGDPGCDIEELRLNPD